MHGVSPELRRHQSGPDGVFRVDNRVIADGMKLRVLCQQSATEPTSWSLSSHMVYETINFDLAGGMIGFGFVSLTLGIYAWATGQPYGIWYPLALLGFISCAVFGGLFPMILRRYRNAEQRKIDAQGLRGE